MVSPRRKGTKITTSMPAGVSYRGKCHHSQLALRQDRLCACQHCGEYKKPAWGGLLLLPVRCLGMDGSCVDVALGDCVPLLDHLGVLSSDLPPSPPCPAVFPWAGAVLGPARSRVRFQVISTGILNYRADGPRGSVSLRPAMTQVGRPHRLAVGLQSASRSPPCDCTGRTSSLRTPLCVTHSPRSSMRRTELGPS